MKLSTGSKGLLIAAAVGGGKILAWHHVDEQWGGKAAQKWYAEVLSPALKKHYKGIKTFSILEDNDPTGNCSGLGVKAKAAAKLSVFKIPKRSPDLNVLDYAIWSEMEKRMRAMERKFPKDKKETRAQFRDRLAKIAAGLDEKFIEAEIVATMYYSGKRTN